MGLLKSRNLILLTWLAIILLPKIRAAECDTETEFTCNDGSCIPIERKCNQENDCGAGEDEQDCENDEFDGRYQCRDGTYISEEQRCDRVNDCQHGDDEDPSFCNELDIQSCGEDEFSCDESKCIANDYKCDGISDCNDGTDETGCSTTNGTDTECSPGEFRCANAECIDEKDRCNGIADCSDNSDEQECRTCSDSAFQCETSLQCIPDYKECDGEPDCDDGSDENSDKCDHPDQGSKNCEENEFRCNDGNCINSDFECDDHQDCADGSDEDEQYCATKPVDSNKCKEGDLFCGGKCVERERICDGYPDCLDHADELNCQPEPDEGPDRCPEDECSDGTCIYSVQRCDGRTDCPRGDDEHGCPCRDDEFQCQDGTCIPSSRKCDRRPDCPDRSDEVDCVVCRPNEFQCSTGECIDERRRCDRHVDCRDGTDENNCPTRPPPTPFSTTRSLRCYPHQWQCNSGECISRSARCDGVPADCRDNSDEQDCTSLSAPSDSRPGTALNLKTYPNEQTIKERIIKEGREVVFQCRDEGPLRARVKWTRRGRTLPQGSKDLNGRLEIPDIRMEHGGEYVCEAVGYSNLPHGSVVVNLNVEKFNRSQIIKGCGHDEATCMNGECIKRSKICDGVFDCTDSSDESSCNIGRCEPNEFKCGTRKCVLKTWRCDGENDCGDNSDEQGCETQQASSGICRYDEFQCANRQCIPRSFQCDSQSDCGDNSDEIGCQTPQVITPPPPMVRLQSGFVFNITCRATGNPVPLIVWRLNWGHIPEKCRTTSVNGFGTLTCPDIQPIDSGAYSCEIINSMGTTFVSPDTILIVDSRQPMDNPLACPSGKFNSKAQRPDECINCFCFGVSTQCSSADLFIYSLNPPVTSQTVVGVEGPWSGLSEVRIGEYDRHTLTSTRHGVQFRISDVPSVNNQVYPFFALPAQYLGNQLRSYGGFLRYEVEFNGRGRSNDIPDVIVQGNGYTLTYRHLNPLYSNQRTNITAPFASGSWYKLNGDYASREEVMMVLANVESVLIKLQYIDSGERSVELVHVSMDSSANRDQGLGSASLVEECRCPNGYSGLSCESCADGYVRQSSGPWLGRCIREEEPCRPGTYGDPSRGIACKPCPCPTPGQSRAVSCSMDGRGNPVCHCQREYTGTRCELCASGYIGNPLSTRGCYRGPVNNCDADGTQQATSDGRCICKPEVEGARCDQCARGAFYLHWRGCVNCFCMGVAQQCSSSSLYRDTIRSNFITNQASDIALVLGYDNPEPVAARMPVQNKEVTFREFNAIDDTTHYWSLPPAFLGNKLTSYGGNLTYTVRYSSSNGGASRSNSPDVVIVSGNEITLHHYRHETRPPVGQQTFSVMLFENFWQHYSDDGKPANRPHLLMALANVTAIYIKATYTTLAQEASLSSVSLDHASEQSFGREKVRAWEVEQCVCPHGHQGLSCEDCSPGFYKSDQGLYLGLCEPCECNGHSEECDSRTGICLNCRGNTYGDNCEECRPGFIGNATSGGCVPISSQGRCTDCDASGTASCDERTGQCHCKPNVQGRRCDQCRDGSFGLNEVNEYGCTECFCSGKTRSCTAGHYYRDDIPIFLIDEANHLTLTDRDGVVELPAEDLSVNVEENQMVASINDDSVIYFWNMPARLTGNLIASYGGHIEFELNADGNGRDVEDQDVIIKGNGITLFHVRHDLSDNQVRVPFIESEWMTQNRVGPRPATRSDLLSVLSNVESIQVRASTRDFTSESKISDITLTTAVSQHTSHGLVDHIEVCRCPHGYRGTSCEQCDTLFYRDHSGNCAACPCQNADSCSLGRDRRVQCSCMQGWSGEYCRDPVRETPSEQTTPRPRPSIRVVINTPQIKIVEIGETTEFNCQAHYLINNNPVQIRWFKYDGSISDRVYIDRGSMVIRDAQIDDSGVYVCQAQYGSEVVRDNVTVTVGDKTFPTAPEVTIAPNFIDEPEYSNVEIRCTASGNPRPRVQWERIDGSQISSDVLIREGYLRFNSLRKSDEGTYRCAAQNDAGDGDQVIQIYVQEQRQAPTRPPPTPSREIVTVSPARFDGEPGEDVTLRCQSNPRGRVTWSKAGSVELPRNAEIAEDELIIRYPTADDSGRYTCTVQFSSGNTRTAHSDVNIIVRSNDQPPKIRVLEKKYSTVQGKDFEVTCEASGTPYPEVSWKKGNEDLTGNARQTGNVLRILNLSPENSGIYICLASNDAGSDQVAIILEVERREPPVIEIYPQEPQKLRIGESARLSCRVIGGHPYPSVTFTRFGGAALSSRFTEDYPGVITLREAQLEDGGVYECVARNEAGETRLSSSVEITQPPVLTMEPDQETMILTEGDELRFTCSAHGTPAPSVRIEVPENSGVRASVPRLDSARQRSGRPEASIAHYNVQQHQSGVYSCVAENEAGEDRKYVQVIVNPKRGDVGVHDNDDFDNDINNRPHIPYPHPDPEENIPARPNAPARPSTFNVHLNERAEFNCQGEGNIMRTEWKRADGRPLPRNSYVRGGQLVIENVQHDSEGYYECIAYDQQTRRPIVLINAHLRVLAGPPKIVFNPPMPISVKSGEDVIIFCNATGEGPLRVHWHGEGGYELPDTVDVRGNYLRFSRIAPADQGRYVCTASNLYGNVTKVAEVIVNNVHSTNDYQPMGSQREAYEGDDVSLKCFDESLISKFVRYEWERDRSSLPPLAEVRDNELLLRSTRYDDSGRYICRSFSADGTESQNYVDLVIKQPIPKLTIEPNLAYVKPGDDLELTCTSSVGANSEISWERSGRHNLPQTSEVRDNVLIISNAQPSHNGIYKCISKLPDGTVIKKEYELSVDVPAQIIDSRFEHAAIGSTVTLRCNFHKYPATFTWSRQHGTFAPEIDVNSDTLKLINIQGSDAGTYICSALHNGKVTEVPTTLVVTGTIPFFPQSPNSYIKLPKLDQAYSKFNFEVTFRPERPNGLILYNGQQRGSGDYISLSLVDGVPQFRYSFGDQHGVLAPENPLSLGEWHTVKVNRVRTNGWMIVDDQHPVTFPPNQRFQGLNLEEELYLGGVPRYDYIAPTASDVKEGFVGCISRLLLNERDIQINTESIDIHGTTACEPCADEPCKNGGVCLETQTEHGYTCACEEGYTGKNCQVKGSTCTIGVCGTGRCEESDMGIECNCPLNRTGDRCQYIEHYREGILSFRDRSYAAYDRLVGKKNLKFKIRPETDDDGVILYAAESEKAFGDFIAVVLKDKHIEFRYVVGGKFVPVTLRSQTPVKVNEWMDISFGRSRAGLGYLQVDNEPQVNEVKSGGKAQTLYLRTNLYVGGFDKRVVLNRGVGVSKGFQGCVAGLEISGRSVNMIADLVDSANVGSCGHELTDTNEIESSGESEVHTTQAPTPCRPGYGGRGCSSIIDVCIANEPCENGGICSSRAGGKKYVCDCTLGYTGENCQYSVNLQQTASFKGNGYLELDRDAIANSSHQLTGGLAVLFSTKQPNGLIIWYGQNRSNAFSDDDFLALAVTDGILELRCRLNGEEAHIQHMGIRVDTNQRHIAIIKRRENQFSLELDGLNEYGEIRPTERKEMILPGHVLLGGAPNLSSFTGNRYTNGFVGCIHTVEPLEGGVVNLGQRTISSLNVDSCSDSDNNDDVMLGTEPPVV